jgi:hypothetical protein
MSRSIGNVVVPSSRPPTYTVFPSGSGTYTSPIGCSYLIVEICGGGGGGGCSNTIQSGGGGGAGAYIKTRLPAGTYSYAVGSGGTNVLPGNSGNGGFGSSFGAFLIAGGGNGGSVTGGGAGGNGGAPTVGAGTTIMSVRGGDGGSSAFNNFSSAGGQCFFGTAQPVYYTNNSQNIDGFGYGAGGIGANTIIGISGAGANGRIIITEFY